MNAGDKVLSTVSVACLLVAGFIAGASAQSGSVGGAIPKMNKTLSGDDGESSAPRETARKRPAKSNATLNGRWRVSQKCNQGRFEIELNITHTSPTQFGGTSIGITTGKRSTIVDGHLNGRSAEFTRQSGMLSDRWTARLTGAGRLAGTSVGPAWRCSYTAVRK